MARLIAIPVTKPTYGLHPVKQMPFPHVQKEFYDDALGKNASFSPLHLKINPPLELTIYRDNK
jgi:hypothetical protein